MPSSLYRVLHRVIGLSVAVFVVGFVATGLPLQFTDALALGSRGVPYLWVHDAYGVHAPDVERASNGVVQVGDMVFTEFHEIRVEGDLRGAQPIDSVLAVATSAELLLLPADPDMPVERTSVQDPINRFGTGAGRELAVDTARGVLLSDDLGASWRLGDGTPIEWIEVSSGAASREFARRFGAAHVAWERWLQDLHSGRFFGPVGVWVMNIAGVALLVLSMTGFIVWFSGRKNSRSAGSDATD